VQAETLFIRPRWWQELESNVGDFLIDCARMPAAKDLLDTKSQSFTMVGAGIRDA